MTNERPVESVQLESSNPLDDRRAALRDLYPEAFTEGQLDLDKFRAAVGDVVDDRPERYTFSWAGKRDAIRLLQTPTRATLVPCREESVDFDDTQHLFIEGDNLEVLKLLYRPYFGRVKMIYIDPPYNTGNDFIYPDNYADPLATYLQLTGQADAEGNLLTSNPETSGRYHSAWLSMMYPRLFLARQLLREDGVIFVSIDDNEVHNLRLLLNEVFGEENFVASIVWQKKYAKQSDATWFSTSHDYILVYAHNKSHWLPNLLPRTEKQLRNYRNPDDDPRGPWQSVVYTCNKTRAERPNLYYPIVHPRTKEKIHPSETRVWAYEPETHKKHVAENRLWWGKDDEKKKPRMKVFLREVSAGIVPDTLWLRTEVGDTQEAARTILDLFGHVAFDTPKPTKLIRRMLHLSTEGDSEDTVLDFFAGSSSTAEAVLRANRQSNGNRRFIMVQLPEPVRNSDFATVADISKERIRRVIANMEEGAQSTEDLGFKVFKLAPSSFQLWAGTEQHEPDAYTEQLSLFADPLVDDWQPEDVIYEIALKEGYDLNCTIEQVGTSQLYRVTDPDRDQSFTISLDDSLDAGAVQALNLTRDDLFICRDIALTDDLAANLALQCRLKTI